MVLVGDFTNFAQKVHVIDAAQFVFVQESYETFQFSRWQLFDDLWENIEQALSRD